MPFAFVLMLFVALAPTACSRQDAAAVSAEASAPWVRTVALRGNPHSELALTGRVHARVETPLAFQVDGRIAKRLVDAGQQVDAGQALFELDPQDWRAAVRAAEAAREAAEAELQTAESELLRQRDLLNRKFVGRQSYDRAALLARAARAQRKAAQAELERARHGLGYTVLRAGHAGVLIEVSAEAGQVIDTGQTVAVLAADGEREVEVGLPDGRRAPEKGRALSGDGKASDLVLREVAGAADAASLTWRTRYRLLDAARFSLGSVVRVSFAEAAAGNVFEVPIGALDERADGPRIWRVVNGKVQAEPVAVLAVGADTARISAALPPDARVVAFGTHLLTPGMRVREQRR